MGQYLTPRQKGIVNRYYANADARVAGALQELVSDLALSESDAARAKLWQKADDHLTRCGVARAEIDRSVGKRDVKALAELVAKVLATPGELGAKKPRAISDRP